ncbi:MAG: STAS domain-containing protein [Pontibacterium sp.]
MSVTAYYSDQVVRLEGEILFSSVAQLAADVEPMIAASQSDVTVDFSAITRVDSSALTFWLHCLRYAKKSGINVYASALPKSMLSIAELVGIEAFINKV